MDFILIFQINFSDIFCSIFIKKIPNVFAKIPKCFCIIVLRILYLFRVSFKNLVSFSNK